MRGIEAMWTNGKRDTVNERMEVRSPLSIQSYSHEGKIQI